MFAVTAILSCVIKIRGLFKSTKWRHFENVKFEALSARRVLQWWPNPPSNQKDSFLRSGGICILNLSFLCLKKMAERETFILLPWQLIYPRNHTQKLLFKSTVTSIPNLGLLHWDIEISLCCHGDLFPIEKEIWKYEGKLSAKLLISLVKDIGMMRIL